MVLQLAIGENEELADLIDALDAALVSDGDRVDGRRRCDHADVDRGSALARRSPVPGHGREYSGPRPPHGASAATISNGLCDHTRAMPRPVANIVRARVCVTLRTELATFGRTAVTLSRSLPGRSRGHVPQYAPADVAYDR